MLLCLDIKKNPFEKNNIIINDKTKNNVMPDPNSYFSRILYSNQNITLNGLYLKFVLSNVKVVNSYSKKIFYIDRNVNNKKTIEHICYIEKSIINKYFSCKNKKYKIQNQLLQNSLKLFDDSIKQGKYTMFNFILKISGVWENETDFGLTYKFISIK
tara:strand:- start:779 stop:1249 length:471 start_codon:yes stop_codon:yes gene_type:complete